MCKSQLNEYSITELPCCFHVSLWADFPSTCFSLLSSQAGHPLSHPRAEQTSPQCQRPHLMVLGLGMKPWVGAVLSEQVTWSWRAPLCCLNPRQSAALPQPPTLWRQSPSRPPRPLSPPREPPIQDSLSQSLQLPAALWTLTLKKRRRVRRPCDQKVRIQHTDTPVLLLFCIFFSFFCITLKPFFSLFVAAVTGYQQPSETASGHASQFYISVLDSNNKEQRLDEKGTNTVLFSNFYISEFSKIAC